MNDAHGLPQFNQKILDDKGNLNRAWYLFFKSLVVPFPESSITVSSSPFVYTSTDNGWVLMTGGTVASVSLTRVSAVSTGQTTGYFMMGAGDKLTVSYSVTPTMTFYSQ